jgi:hypothetical protein
MLARRIGRAAPADTRAEVPELAPGLAATDQIRLAGAALPLWLVVGGGGVLVVLVAIGLVLTLRDRERRVTEPLLSDTDTVELPVNVKFG